MAEFYDQIDLWLWEFSITKANNKIHVTEDPGGTPSSFTASIRTDDSSSVSSYFASSSQNTYTGTSPVPSPADSTDVLTGPQDPLTATHLYSEIADQLTAESAANGKGRTYDISTAEPTSGPDYRTSGVKIIISSGNFSIDFSGADSINPRFLGFPDNGATQKSSGGELVSRFGRWGNWFSPDPSHDKRPRPMQNSFQSAENRRRAKKWRYTELERPRPHHYRAVEGVHVWPYDRASRSGPSSRGGLGQGDRNNALWDLWRKANWGDRNVIVVEKTALGYGIAAGFREGDEICVGRYAGEFDDTFDPHERQDRRYPYERYDFDLIVSEAKPSEYSSAVNRYQH